jgi:hypothetical protein
LLVIVETCEYDVELLALASEIDIVAVSIPEWVKGGCRRYVDGTVGLPPAPEIPRAPRQLRLVPHPGLFAADEVVMGRNVFGASTSSSKRGLASFRSAVLKPSVNQS